MSETRDPAIKLFGKTIPLPMNEENPTLFNDGGGGCVNPSSKEKNNNNSKKEEEEEEEEEEEAIELKDPVSSNESEEKDGSLSPISEGRTILATSSSGNNENPKTPSNDKETAVPNSSKTEEEQSESSMSDEKTLKKPDKIIPCPRCNSMDTKFCYYNNYNVNQPRHFCKNCQRYWTAGGTMRNVPVGAGRRKNKNSASHYRHITVSEALQTAKANIPEGIQHPALKRNGTVLTFGPDAPLCESMASVLSLADTTMRNCQRNGFHGAEEHRIPDSCGGEEISSRGSVTASNFPEGCRVGVQDSMMPNCHGFPQQMPCFPPGSPWPYPWNPTQWNSAVPPPGFCAPNFPMPFYPAAPYWGCAVPGNWTLPWLSQPSSSPNQGAPGSSPFSPNLGKHSRGGEMIQRSNSDNEDQQSQSSSEKCLWIPKTLRIDDPDEAARSSIWATLGIKNDIADSISGGRLFKAFQSKGDNKNNKMENSQLLQANPAAMSRSLNFQESL